jgi:hypothetical protein
MIRDRQNTFSNDQAITADALSTNVIDLGPLSAGNTIRDIGAGEPLYLHVLVKEAFATSGSATLTVTLESDSTSDLATSATVHATIASAVAAASLIAGAWIAKGIPIPSSAYERFLGLRFTTNTADFTAGKVDAWLSDNRYDDRTYESGYSTGVN